MLGNITSSTFKGINMIKHQIKVLAIDHCPVITKGIVSFLLTEQHLFAVDTASNVKDSLVIAKQWQPAIVIIDLDMLYVNLIERFKQAYSATKVIVFVELKYKDSISHDLVNGAHGLLLKNCSQNEMVESIQKVNNDDFYISRSLEHMWNPPDTSHYLASDNTHIWTPLTNREREVLFLISQGFHNKEIAARLGIKNRTVEFHTSNILSKLGASTRTQAVSIYQKNIVLK